MGLDRVFSTPTINVDQDKYDELIRIQTLYKERIDKNMKIMISQPMNGKTEEQIRNERASLVKEYLLKKHLKEMQDYII